MKKFLDFLVFMTFFCAVLIIGEIGFKLGSDYNRTEIINIAYDRFDQEERVVFVANGLEIWEGSSPPICFKEVVTSFVAKHTLPEDLYYMHEYEKFVNSVLKQNFCLPETPCSSFVINEELKVNIIQ